MKKLTHYQNSKENPSATAILVVSTKYYTEKTE